MKSSFCIAGHTICLHGADLSLLPNFEPFRCDDDAPALLHIYIGDDCPALPVQAQEIGQFDCGGTNHGVYRADDGAYLFEVSDSSGLLCAAMHASADFRECHIGVVATSAASRAFGLGNCLMMAYAFATAPLATLLMHASVIRKDGRAYAMTAPSGTGKSTHTYLWYKYIEGCDLMNDDNPVVRVIDGEARIYGSPWSGKTRCYRNTWAPVGAFVRIRQHPRNEIRPLTTIEAFAALLPAMSSMKWDHRVHTAVCDTIGQVLQSGTKVYELKCLPDAEAARLCYETVSR